MSSASTVYGAIHVHSSLNHCAKPFAMLSPRLLVVSAVSTEGFLFFLLQIAAHLYTNHCAPFYISTTGRERRFSLLSRRITFAGPSLAEYRVFISANHIAPCFERGTII